MTTAAWAVGLLADGEMGSAAMYGVIGLVAGLVIGAVAVWLATERPAPSAPDTPAGPPKPSAEPLRLLALLQREGRLHAGWPG